MVTRRHGAGPLIRNETEQEWPSLAVEPLEIVAQDQGSELIVDRDARYRQYQQAIVDRSARVIGVGALENLTPGVATLEADGSLTRVGAGGLAKIRMVHQGRARQAQVVVEQLAYGDTHSVLDEWIAGSVAHHVATAVDSRLAGKDPATALRAYTTQNHAAGTYVRNPGLWCADMPDVLTCVSPWNSTGGATMGGILISPRHVLFAAHYHPANGATMRFVAMDGTVITRTLVSVIKHPDYVTGNPYPDIAVGVLDSDVPASISFAKVLPDNWDQYIPGLGEKSWRRLPVITFDQEEKVTVRDWVAEGSYGKYTSFGIPLDAKRLEFYETIVPGDSSNPGILPINSEPVALTAFSTSLSGTSLSLLKADVNSMMTSLGGGYQLTEAEFSGFFSYPFSGVVDPVFLFEPAMTGSMTPSVGSLTAVRTNAALFVGDDGLYQYGPENLLASNMGPGITSNAGSSTSASAEVTPGGDAAVLRQFNGATLQPRFYRFSSEYSAILAAGGKCSAGIIVKKHESLPPPPYLVLGSSRIDARVFFDTSDWSVASTAGTTVDRGEAIDLGDGWMLLMLRMSDYPNSFQEVIQVIATESPDQPITTTAENYYLYEGQAYAGRGWQVISDVGRAYRGPRIDYDPMTGVCLGYLFEDAATNLIANSLSFSSWASYGTATATASPVVDPMGETGAYLIDSATVNAGREIYANTVIGSRYCLSVFVRLNDGSSAATVSILDGNDAVNSKLIYNVATGAFSSVGSAVTDYGAKAYPNGWVRIHMTFTAATAVVAARMISYTGDPALFWQAQLELGLKPTSPIFTAGATATRNADSASGLLGVSFAAGSLYFEGERYADVSTQWGGGFPREAVLSDSAAETSHWVAIFGTSDGSSSERLYVQQGGALRASIADVPVVGGGVVYRKAARFGANDCALQVDDRALGTYTANGLSPTVNKIHLGNRPEADRSFTGHIRRVAVWDTKLDDTTLQTITL